MLMRLFSAVALAALATTSAFAEDRPASKVTVVFDHPIPNIPGKSMRGVLVEYGPGAGSPSHTHPKTAFIYATVLEGSIRSAVNGAPAKVYNVGENFIEEPGSHHEVSANASDSKPAKLLAVFVLDTNEKELVTPIKK
jgi:quercetin dioxygenase-like cupin family protein